MSDAYLKVKDNGANGLAIVREESDVSVADLKSAIYNEKYALTGWTKALFNADGTINTATNGSVSPAKEYLVGTNVVLASGCRAVIAYYSDSEYIGKVAADGSINKTAGSWKYFTGEFNTYDYAPSIAKYVRLCVIPTDGTTLTTSNVMTWTNSHCELYYPVPVKNAVDIENVKNSLRLDGDVDLISGGRRVNETVQSVIFTWNADKTVCTVNGTNSSSSAQARQVFAGGVGAAQLPEGLVPGEKYYVSCASTSGNVGLSFYFYINGTWNSVQYFTGNGILNIPSSATGIDVAIAVRPSQTASNDVVSNIALQKFPAESVVKDRTLGVVGTNTYKTVQNAAHSSAYDQVTGTFKAGKSYIVRMNADTSTAFEWQVFAFASGTGTKVATANTGTLNGDQVRFTLDADADAIGIYTAPIDEASFKVSFAVEKPEPRELSVDDYDYDTKVREFAATLNNTGAVDSFVWFTDPHLMKVGDTPSIYSNFLYYTGVIGGFYDRTPTQFALCGGDWIEWWDTQALACFKLGWITGRMKELFGDYYYTAIGNHDTDEQGNSPRWLTDSTLRNVMLPRESELYYSFKAQNSRFYVLNTDTDHETDMTYTDTRGTHNRWTQVEWLGEQLKVNDDTHSAICMHIAWGLNERVDPMADYVQQLVGAYNSHSTITLNNTAYNFTTCSGKVGFIICGHGHEDRADTTTYSVPIIETLNTQNGNVPSFDLVTVDWTANTMQMIRVGTGSNRSFTLA